MEANLQFMSIADAVVPTGQLNKSFEEVRCDDYLQAYQTRGRAPEPVPQEPADDFARKTLNLPPLFKPTAVPAVPPGDRLPPLNPLTASSTIPASLFPALLAGSTTGTGTGGDGGGAGIGTVMGMGTGKPRVTDPTQLPAAQVFAVTQAATGSQAAGEKYYTISAMPEFGFFSTEELRYYAYLTGNKAPPPAAGVEPQPFMAEKGPSAPAGGTKVEGETLFSISARPGYEKHSPEEFRVAYMLFGRDMASAELSALQNPTAAASALPPAAAPLQVSLTAPRPAPATLSPFGSGSLVPPAAAASTTTLAPAPTLSSAPSAGMFTFGFRPR